MGASLTFVDEDLGMQDIIDEISKEGGHVDIGIQPDEEETLLIIAAANEFGAKINHKGGTSYGYKSKSDAKKGKVRFLKKGSGFMELGKTKAHVITIPARPYIRSTIDGNEEKFLKYSETLSNEIVKGKMSKHDALQLMGQLIEGEIKRTIINLRSPPNAKSTIRKKGSNNPLVDTGLLGGSIRYIVDTGKGEE